MMNELNVLLRCVAAESEEERMKAIQDARKILAETGSVEEKIPLKKRIQNLLITVGTPTSQLGFQYLVDAIQLCCDDEEYLRDITKRLYPDIAKKHGRTKTSIERSIRASIETAWDRGDSDILYGLFGNTISQNKGKPTNAEFLSRLVMEFK